MIVNTGRGHSSVAAPTVGCSTKCKKAHISCIHWDAMAQPIVTCSTGVTFGESKTKMTTSTPTGKPRGKKTISDTKTNSLVLVQ